MIEDIHPGLILVGLVLCVILAALCAGAETGLMALNQHRLRNLIARGQTRAVVAARLLERPDRLIGILLLGNTFFKVCAAGLAAVLGWRLGGDLGAVLAAVLFSLVVLVVADLAPKAAATLNPERFGIALAPWFAPFIWLFSPLAWLLNTFTRGLLWIGRFVPQRDGGAEAISPAELRSVINEVAEVVPRRHLRVLAGLLELENITVEEIMVPRAEIVGLDLTDPWPRILERLSTTRHTRLPVYCDNLDQIEGILYVGAAIPLVIQARSDAADLRKILRPAYFIPTGVSLHAQLLNFQNHQQSLGLVVNEYGDIRGILTVEDILNEIVNELSPESNSSFHDIVSEPDGDGSYLVDGGVNIRELNRHLGWKLPTAGPKTLNGLIMEHFEELPAIGQEFLLAGYPMEILHIGGNIVKTVRIRPR